MTKALKSLLSIDLLNEEQKPTQQSLKVISHAEQLNDATIDSFISKLEQDENSINSNQSIEQFEAGNDSATYFWLCDQKEIKKQNKNIKTKNNNILTFNSIYCLGNITIFKLDFNQRIRLVAKHE